MSKIGVEQTVASFASGQPLVYGVLTVALSIFVGWLGGVIFRAHEHFVRGSGLDTAARRLAADGIDAVVAQHEHAERLVREQPGKARSKTSRPPA